MAPKTSSHFSPPMRSRLSGTSPARKRYHKPPAFRERPPGGRQDTCPFFPLQRATHVAMCNGSVLGRTVRRACVNVRTHRRHACSGAFDCAEPECTWASRWLHAFLSHVLCSDVSELLKGHYRAEIASYVLLFLVSSGTLLPYTSKRTTCDFQHDVEL